MASAPMKAEPDATNRGAAPVTDEMLADDVDEADAEDERLCGGTVGEEMQGPPLQSAASARSMGVWSAQKVVE